MGLEAAISRPDPGACPVAETSESAGARIDSVARSSAVGTVIEEFGCPVVVDRGRLTDRQRGTRNRVRDGVLRTSERSQRRGDRRLDINPATFREHLSAAQSKLLISIVDE